MTESDSAMWSEIGLHVEQRQWAVRIEQTGEGLLQISKPWKSFPEVDPQLQLMMHYPHPDEAVDKDEPYQSASMNINLPPDVAAELGAWLCEHADDDPSVAVERDSDE